VGENGYGGAVKKIGLEHRTPVYGELKGIDDLSVTIDEGDFIAIVGPSGYGKSTLLNALAGIADGVSLSCKTRLVFCFLGEPC
jgi:ABC-type Fe3+/spermidine/putrescine transport system ATPase subunit